MSLGLLFPLGLSALLALLLPLLIHLARRDRRQPVVFSALRWLRAHPRPRQRLRFDEWLLLALRLLLLALLALWLAQPVLRGAPDRRPYVVVMPGVAATTIAGQMLPKDARRHWLAEGFPLLDAPSPATAQPISSLLRQLDAELAREAPLIVLATPQFDGADAQRLRLSPRRIDWRIVDGTPPANATVRAPAPPRLRIYADPSHASATRWPRAAAFAWHANGTGASLHGIGDAMPAEHRDTILWLADGPLPAALRQWVEDGGTALLGAGVPWPATMTAQPLWRDRDGDVLAEGHALGRGRLLRFTRPLAPAAMPVLSDADFPAQLRALLQPPAGPPARAVASAHAPLAGARAYPDAARNLQSWLALVIALLFVIERWLATRRRDGAPA